MTKRKYTITEEGRRRMSEGGKKAPGPFKTDRELAVRAGKIRAAKRKLNDET